MNHRFIPAQEEQTNGGAMSVDEFCRWARVGRTKAYAEAKAGRLLLRKIGAKTVIRTEDAQAWLAALPLMASKT